MFPLLATIVTGRSWQVVGRDGIKNVDFTREEDDEIRDGAGQFLPHISTVLGNVPSEMLLVLKTNDHLRGLDHTYGVRGHASGFVDMSKCCLRALRELKHERIDPNLPAVTKWWKAMQSDFNINIDLLKLFVYEWLLWALQLAGYTEHDQGKSKSSPNRTKISSAFVLRAS
uniref:Uncharacterized protein n=1 Tax=Ciona savignyi TaxID=51511 RepID=H2YDM4_CIOSA